MALTPYISIEDEIPEEILSYESYLSVYENHYDDISEIIDESDEVLGWLLEGTYKKGGLYWKLQMKLLRILWK